MPNPKTTRKQPPPLRGPGRPSAFDKAMDDLRRQPATTFEMVSPRWLLKAAGVVLAGALVCAWLLLCLLYWQGSWQLLYHPRAAITRTPASLGLAYEPVKFAATETGLTQLTGWWLPRPLAAHTVLYLHGADGNLSDTVDTLGALQQAGLAVFAVDYRGYGQSAPAKPSEQRLLADAQAALGWLTQTRQIPANQIVVYGSGLGANLAAELAAGVAAGHGSVGGVILDQPASEGAAPIFNDARSRLVPARWLVADRWDLSAAAGSLHAPSLWLLPQSKGSQPATPAAAYRTVPGKKSAVWLTPPPVSDPNFASELHRWLDDL